MTENSKITVLISSARPRSPVSSKLRAPGADPERRIYDARSPISAGGCDKSVVNGVVTAARLISCSCSPDRPVKRTQSPRLSGSHSLIYDVYRMYWVLWEMQVIGEWYGCRLGDFWQVHNYMTPLYYKQERLRSPHLFFPWEVFVRKMVICSIGLCIIVFIRK